MKDKRIDATHIEVLFNQEDIVKHGLGRYIGTSRDNQAKPKIMAGPFERVAVVELKDKYENVLIKTAESVEMTSDSEVRLVLKVADDNRVEMVNKHPDTLVYRLNDKKKDNKKEDIMSDVLYVNSKRACVTVKKDEFDGSEAAVEKLAKYIGQYGNIADYSVTATDEGSTVVFALAKDSYEFAMDSAVKKAGGELPETSFKAANTDQSDSETIEKLASAVEDKLIEKVASGEISKEAAKEVYAEFLKEVYADGRDSFTSDISDEDYKYKLHILNDILPKETHARSHLTKYMYEHDTGDMVKDLSDALFNYAIENPSKHEVVKECVSKLLMDPEIKGNANVKNLAEYFQIPVPSDTVALEVYADNEKGVTNPELATGEKDLVSVVKLEGSEGVFSAVDFDGNSYFTKALMSGLEGKSGSIEEISAMITSIIPGSTVQQGNGRDQYSFENGVGLQEEDNFQNLIDEAFNDDDEIGDSGLSTLDEKSKNIAIAAIEKALTRFADMMETTSLTGNSNTIPTDASKTNTVTKDGKTYTPTIDPATGEPAVDESGKITYTAEDGDVQQWTQNEVTSFATNATIDPSQVVTTASVRKASRSSKVEEETNITIINRILNGTNFEYRESGYLEHYDICAKDRSSYSYEELEDITHKLEDAGFICKEGIVGDDGDYIGASFYKDSTSDIEREELTAINSVLDGTIFELRDPAYVDSYDIYTKDDSPILDYTEELEKLEEELKKFDIYSNAELIGYNSSGLRFYARHPQ